MIKWLSKRIAKKYGINGEYEFYRCNSCKALVSTIDISKGSCKCGATRISPAAVRATEKIKIIFGAICG